VVEDVLLSVPAAAASFWKVDLPRNDLCDRKNCAENKKSLLPILLAPRMLTMRDPAWADSPAVCRELRRKYTPVLAKHSKHFSLEDSLAAWHRQYLRLARNKHHGVAKVAIARKLSIRLYWMLRSGQGYEQVKERSSHAGQSV